MHIRFACSFIPSNHLVGDLNRFDVAIVRATSPVPNLLNLKCVQFIVEHRGHLLWLKLIQVCYGNLGDASGKSLIVTSEGLQNR
jgi:hypothetical protein